MFLFVGLTVGLLFAVRAAGRPATVRRGRAVLLGLELAQGTIGFVQYFTDLPIVLVGFHLLGAALISAAVTWVLLAGPRDAVPATDMATTAGLHPRGQAVAVVLSLIDAIRPDVRLPESPENFRSARSPGVAQPVSSGSSATATKSSER